MEINEALRTSSKRGTGKKGFPEFVAQVGDFIIVIEDKAEIEKQAKMTFLMESISLISH